MNSPHPPAAPSPQGEGKIGLFACLISPHPPAAPSPQGKGRWTRWFCGNELIYGENVVYLRV